MDRFDLAVQLHAVPHQGLVVERQALTSAEIALQVDAAHHRQRARQGRLNGRLSVAELNRVAVLTSAGQALMHQAAQRWGWSARAWHRTLRVARTIADLNDDSSIHESHVAQAIEMHRATELG
jgi:magnesium chelatase family protein